MNGYEFLKTERRIFLKHCNQHLGRNQLELLSEKNYVRALRVNRDQKKNYQYNESKILLLLT